MFADVPPERSDSLETGPAGKSPYEVVQTGFKMYWSSSGFSPCKRSREEAELVRAISTSVQQLPIDTVLQPELSIQRIFVSDRLSNTSGRVAALVEFMNDEGRCCLWYADKVARIEEGAAMLAAVTVPGTDSYQLHTLLDDRAFRSELRRIQNYEVDSDSIETPISVLAAGNWLRQVYGKPEIDVLRIRENGNRHRVTTTAGDYDVEFTCHGVSRLLGCRFQNGTIC